MIIAIIAAISLLVGFLASVPIMNREYKEELNYVKQIAEKAIKDAADDAYLLGYQRCYSHEVTNNKRAGGERTVLMGAIS